MGVGISETIGVEAGIPIQVEPQHHRLAGQARQVRGCAPFDPMPQIVRGQRRDLFAAEAAQGLARRITQLHLDCASRGIRVHEQVPAGKSDRLGLDDPHGSGTVGFQTDVAVLAQEGDAEIADGMLCSANHSWPP